MNGEEPLSRLRETVASWYVDYASAREIVFAACELLVAGIDGPAVVAVAAVDVSAADEKVPELVEELLCETGFAVPERGEETTEEHTLRVVAALTAAGALTPATFVIWAGRRYAEDRIAPAARLLELEIAYAHREFFEETPESLDERVLAEARRLAAGLSAR